ncbi:GGDEF domain-containing protein [Enterovirga rhinocerotis]|uniref:diguanylate cyclase n=1 Tax=Enterovirga rhinocerotis TaxID=1339210 RepID=A0A4R7BYC5_9HYPH|nr:sensor domain-containing diguanylate cyclase [Enterovirga rhinocerotis]TDR89026.1 diguanylate cyclase (GGDEF)-like protein [Enterovirga rhinocerotis]
MPLGPNRGAGARAIGPAALLSAPAFLAIAVALACVFGILSRPVGYLATVWPANAIMLGILIRMPAAARASGWLAGAAAYMAVDLATGSTVFKAALLNSANLAGVATAYYVFSFLPDEMKTLRQPASVLYVVIASTLAAGMAGIFGAIANPILFNGGMLRGFAFWFASEFVNYLGILPVILAAPPIRTMRSWRLRRRSQLSWRLPQPALALALSCLVAGTIGGPGAIAIPVPALLWCGLAYGVFGTAMLTLAFTIWSLVVISAQFAVDPAGKVDQNALISGRLGASLIALAPIMVAIVMRNQADLLRRLRLLASRDQLTGSENRRSYYAKTTQIVETGAARLALLMIDLDHFKAINDTYGHASGDEVLATFADRARSCLRRSDLLGRLGGEEFAVSAPDCSIEEASAIAERIREACGATPIRLGDGRLVTVTASIGVAITTAPRATGVDAVLAAADAALYRAKAKGRDRIEISTEAIPHRTTSPGSTVPSKLAFTPLRGR